MGPAGGRKWGMILGKHAFKAVFPQQELVAGMKVGHTFINTGNWGSSI